MIIIDGKKIREEILLKVKNEISNINFKPVFCDVLVGDDPASVQYVQMKARTANSVGVSFHRADFPASINTIDLIKEIKVLNKIPNMCGIIVQLPLPEHIDRQAVLDAIDESLDIDCLGSVASEKFYNNTGVLCPPTALACMTVLESLNFNLVDKTIVVLGQGDLVGKPVAAMLRFKNLSPVLVSSKTENKEDLIKNADIIISGIGKGKYITSDMIKSGAVIIDAGTSESNGSMMGDVDLESVKNVAGYVSPVPGGVGPVTVAVLFKNLLISALQKNK